MSYVTPQKNQGYVFYVGLSSQADSRALKANPTLAFGDFKVSIDGGAFNNLGTTPTAVPASGASVKITLSAAEMNGDNIVVQCIDAAGAEWCDLIYNIQTTVQQIDSLALASTALTNVTWTDAKAGYIDAAITSRNATAPDNAGVAAIKAKTDNLPSDPASNTQVNTRSTYAGADTAGTTTLLGRITGAVPLASDYTPTRAGKLDNLDVAVSSRNAVAPDNTDIIAIKAKTDLLPSDPASNTQVNTRLAASGYTAPDNASIATILSRMLGSGPITWTYTLTDVNTGLPVAQAYLWATTDSVGGNIVAQGLTDNFGKATFHLTAGTYYIWRAKAGWTFVNPDTEVVM